MTRDQQRETVARRREAVAEAYLKGRATSAIAAELSVPQSTVLRDLKALREQWRRAKSESLTHAVDLELAKLALLECEIWQAWERSQQQGVVEKLSKAEDEKPAKAGEPVAPPPVKKRAERTTRTHHGEPRYLMLVMRCLERRAQLLEKDPAGQHDVFAAQLTVREVLDEVSADEEFLKFCRHRAGLLEYQPQKPLGDSDKP